MGEYPRSNGGVPQRALRAGPLGWRATVVLHKLIAVLVGLLVLVLVAIGCGSGSSSSVPAGLVISGAGLQSTQPPWPVEYKHLAQRLKQLGLPPGGKETFHIHALLHIYVNGLLSPLAANIGLDPAKGVESSLHNARPHGHHPYGGLAPVPLHAGRLLRGMGREAWPGATRRPDRVRR